jgi:hypothetical protein
MKKFTSILLLTITSVATAETAVTGNLIDNEAWVLEGDVYTGTLGDDFFIRFGTYGGNAYQDLDFSAYDKVEQIKFGTYLLGCNNEGRLWCDEGTAYDEFVVTLTYGNESWEYSHFPKYNTQEGFEWFEVQAIPNTFSDYGSINLYGKDTGAWEGWFGPISHSHTLDVTYTMYDPVMDNPDIFKDFTGEKIAVNTASQQVELDHNGVVKTPETHPNRSSLVELDHLGAPKPPQLQPLQQSAPVQPVRTSRSPQQPVSQQKEEDKSVDIKIEPKTESKSGQKAPINLSDMMENVTIDGVPAADVGKVDAYNQIAQAVAISLLTAPQLKEVPLLDAPFYEEKSIPDGNIPKAYTGYINYNSEKINKMVDLQWQK